MLRKSNQFFVFLMFFASLIFAQENFRIRETNRNYQSGDWITYSVTRFVRYVSAGDQYIYFATTGGITRYNFFSNQWDYPYTISNGLADNDISLVAQDLNTANLWCTTSQGISYMEPASKWWFNTFYDEMPGFGFDEYITSIGFGDDRRVYIITNENNWFASENVFANFQEVAPPSNEDFIKWFGDKEKNVRELPYFFMSDGYIFNERQRYIDDLHLRNFRITHWVTDPWKNLWLGTWGLGAAHGNLTTFRLDLLEFGLWDETVDAIGRDGDALWLGGIQSHGEPAGITEWTSPPQKPNFYEAYLNTGFDSDAITSIVPDGDIVWIGTQEGLTKYDRRNQSWRTMTTAQRLLNNHISDLLVDDNYIWIAAERGITRVHKKTFGTDSQNIKHIAKKSLANVGVFDMDFQYNLIWVATEFGVFVYDTDKDAGGFYNGVEGPVNTPTFAVSVWRDEVWFGTEEGVAAFNSDTHKWLKPPARMYKTDAEINRILASRDAVWVATNNGVLKYNRRNESWVHFTVYDGLPSNHVYSLLLDGDYIWFGTDRGLTRFYWNSPYRTD
jgi:ligand-binding sensor domain-containing protein